MTLQTIASGVIALQFAVILFLFAYAIAVYRRLAYIKATAGAVVDAALQMQVRIEPLFLPKVEVGAAGDLIRDPDGVYVDEAAESKCYVPVHIGEHSEAVYVVVQTSEGHPTPHGEAVLRLLREFSASGPIKTLPVQLAARLQA